LVLAVWLPHKAGSGKKALRASIINLNHREKQKNSIIKHQQELNLVEKIKGESTLATSSNQRRGRGRKKRGEVRGEREKKKS
jgi:hypothetical protein